MEKPISLQIMDFKGELALLINKSNLPTYILKPVFKDFYDEITRQDILQIEKDKQEYEEKNNKEKGEK